LQSPAVAAVGGGSTSAARLLRAVIARAPLMIHASEASSAFITLAAVGVALRPSSVPV